jgi:hypothetical protein
MMPRPAIAVFDHLAGAFPEIAGIGLGARIAVVASGSIQSVHTPGRRVTRVIGTGIAIATIKRVMNAGAVGAGIVGALVRVVAIHE